MTAPQARRPGTQLAQQVDDHVRESRICIQRTQELLADTGRGIVGSQARLGHPEPAPRVDLELSHDGLVAVVHLVGAHDLATLPDVQQAAEQCGRRPLVVVDLARCTFLDGSVIGALVRLRDQAEDGAGQLLLLDARGIVARALDVLQVRRGLPTL